MRSCVLVSAQQIVTDLSFTLWKLPCAWIVDKMKFFDPLQLSSERLMNTTNSLR